ncbi:MAG: type VI secretion system membrane subunit TssM [Maricaulaceae bacterium]
MAEPAEPPKRKRRFLPWIWTGLALFVLVVVLWVFGPVVSVAGVAPLGPVWARALVIGFLVLATLGTLWLRARGRKKANDALVEGLADDHAKDAPAEEAAQAGRELQASLNAALSALKSARFGAQGEYLYQLPWYVVIGPPGAGKTTALQNSGLTFPLAEHGGDHALRGAGGTRRCDWWLTDEAVLIDTAGRYATQDSDAQSDAAEWRAFLDLLKNARPRQPLNGVIVAFSAAELLGASPGARDAHARAVRSRIEELNERLGLRLPVYVIATKTDLLGGFAETFEPLDAQARDQVWGVSLDLETSQDANAAAKAFDGAFEALIARLNAQVFAKLEAETDRDRRAKLFRFTQEFATLGTAFARFLAETFQAHRYRTPPLVRGAYFTSATQEGAPIDRLLANLTKDFSLPADSGLVGRRTPRSYFLTDLLRKVVFAEAGLAGFDPKAARRTSRLRLTILASGVLAFLGVCGLWGAAYARNAAMVERLGEQALAYQGLVEQAPTARDADLAAVVPPLNALRDLTFATTAPEDRRSAGVSFGLGQTGKARAQIAPIYRRALNAQLSPRILASLEAQLRANLSDPDLAYEILRVYLMAGGRGPQNADAIMAWLSPSWRALYPGSANAELRADLEGHARALYDGPLDDVGVDGGLIDEARAVVQRSTPAARVFSRLKDDPELAAIPDWTVAGAAGPSGPVLFQRLSGEPLSAGVPGLFTRNAYLGPVPAKIRLAAAQAGAERWVAGEQAPTGAEASAEDAAGGEAQGGGASNTAKLVRDATALYLDAFAQSWRSLFADVIVVKPAGVVEGARAIGLAAGPASPIRNTLTSAAQASDLRPPTEGQDAAQAAAAIASTVSTTARRAESALANVAGGPRNDPEAFVIQTFAPLRQAVLAPEGGASQLDAALQALGKLGDDLQASINDSSASEKARAQAQIVDGFIDALPEPAGGWLRALSGGGEAAASAQGRQQLEEQLSGEVAPACADALRGRYPFVADAQEEVRLDDFRRIFGPSGLINSYFRDKLAAYVNAGVRPWRLTPNGTQLGLRASTPRAFERARRITDNFFSGGALGARYTLEVLEIGEGLARADLTIDGANVFGDNGPPRTASFAWPAVDGAGGARFVAQPVTGSPASRTWRGDWAVFRMLDDADAVSQQSSDTLVFTLSVNGASARFRLQAGSVANPFIEAGLGGFACPSRL